MEEIDLFLEDAKESMQKAIVHTENELAKIRAGKANPGMLKGISIEYYGTMTPLDQVASVTTPDARTINIKPWEKPMLALIETAIINSDLGMNPMNNGDFIIISVPQLTEERRRDLVKQAKNETENGKISIRNVRKDTNAALKSLQKDGASEDDIKKAEEEVQKITDSFSKELDAIFNSKEQDIMTI